MMKLLTMTIVTALLTVPVLAGDLPDGAKTRYFDGCLAYLVPDTNYWNFVDATCKTEDSLYQSTAADERRAAREDAAEEDDEGESPAG